IVRLLKQEGWSWWIDDRIALGDDFRPDIEREIDAAASVLVIWTSTALVSTWVRREALRAFVQGKLVEIEVAEGLGGRVDLSEVQGQRLPCITFEQGVRNGPAREALLARIAAIGHLVRPRDSWNATLVVHTRDDESPSHPIIAWEWIDVGTD